MGKGDDITTFDIQRSLVLSEYIREWRQPSRRHSLSSKEHHLPVEIYIFPPTQSVRLYRFATFGMSSQVFEGNMRYFDYEFLVVFSYDIGGCSEDRFLDYLKSIIVHCITEGLKLEPGMTFAPSPIAPEAWGQKALLISEACGEPADVQTFHVGTRTIELVWAIPIYEDERQFIKANGLEAFDNILVEQEWGITDLSRPCFV